MPPDLIAASCTRDLVAEPCGECAACRLAEGTQGGYGVPRQLARHNIVRRR